MLCGNCKKNQATKTYEDIKKGKKTVEYYCLDCYHRLFSASEPKDQADACPYCGTTAEEFKKRNLVGCVQCYTTLKGVVLPVVAKLQGSATHKGKQPLGGQSERTRRRQGELKMMVDKFNAEKDFASARAYTERLMMLQEGTEEDYVWRKRPLSFKRS